MTTLDENTFAKQKDLFVQSLVFIYYKYLQLGLCGSSLAVGKLALFAIAKYRVEPHIGESNPSFSDVYHKNTALTLVSLKNKFGSYADRMLQIVERVDPTFATTYKMFFEETDEEFEKGWDGAEEKLLEAKKFREEIRSGKYAEIGNEDIQQPINESTSNQVRTFSYKDMTCSIEFEPDFESKRLAEHVLAYLQEILVFFLEDKELTWIENQISIHIVSDEHQKHFVISEKANNDQVDFDLIINDIIIKELFTSPFMTLFELERSIFFYILIQCTIDKQADIKAFVEKLDKNDFFKGLSGRVPLGYTMNTFFPKEDFQKLLT